MAATHKIVCTIMGRGVTIDPAHLPMSVLVSPRLSGAPTLGSFGDWLEWTRRCKEHGLSVTVSAGGQAQTLPADTTKLEPKLWEAIFNGKTLVDGYTFRDLTGAPVISYPTRQTLALIKSIFRSGRSRWPSPRRTPMVGNSIL